MSEGTQNTTGTEDPQDKSSGKRDQSTIQFPYVDLDGAIAVARALHNSGGVPISRDQLAGAMNLASGSGNFVIRVAAARMFGLIEYSQGKFSLTDRGHEILEPGRDRKAKADAFLDVPLYRRVYDEFRGKQLPPRPLGLEQAFVKFGVAPKQRDKARVAFDKSATSAGYFQNGTDRLVEPIIVDGPPQTEPERERAPEVKQEPAKPQLDLHPFIRGLLETLPAPGTAWAKDGRKMWLTTAESIFGLIYKEAPSGEGQS